MAFRNPSIEGLKNFRKFFMYDLEDFREPLHRAVEVHYWVIVRGLVFGGLCDLVIAQEKHENTGLNKPCLVQGVLTWNI